MNLNELADKVALRELVDQISILGDNKDFESQVQLISEDAISETIVEGETIMKLEGRNEMANAFANFLQEIDMVYHFNGQQVVTINGDNEAIGKCYCFITLIGNENGKKIKTTIGATYDDEYIRINNQWFISRRVGNFRWQDKTEVTT